VRTIVTNGTIVNADGRVDADLAIKDGVIQAITPRSAGGITPGPDDVVIDATGCLVVPGGVDAHVHM